MEVPGTADAACPYGSVRSIKSSVYLQQVTASSFDGFEFSVGGCFRLTPDPASFDWYALTPSDNISWTPCFGDQQCARLNLPLDYSKPAGPKTQIALQMLPATDKANYQGTVIINPGGPGGSGTLFALEAGAALAQFFGPTYDILGFDPRGTGATTPLAQCFDTPEESDAWLLQEIPVLRVEDGSIPLCRARDEVLSSLCAAKLGGTGREDVNGSAEEWGPGRFMDTASVATDMLNIVEKLGQDKLHYYGVSYGTLLGQYFAAIYPHKVGRMILDGVVDGVAWQTSGDFKSIKDADRVMDVFFTNCARAGADKCPISEKTPHAVAQRVDRILANVRAEPIPLPNSASGPAVVTEDAALSIIFPQLYSPLYGFPLIATVLRAIETRDIAFLSQLSFFSSNVGVPPWLQKHEALPAIDCIDYPPLSDSLRDDRALIGDLVALSRWAGPFTSRLRIVCGAWKIRAKARYTGPVSAHLDVPVLVTSNSIDPVTPLSSARAVVSRFKGMRLLIQDTVGHSTFGSLSSCVALAMSAYMINGTLPPVGTVCKPDLIPLIDSAPNNSRSSFPRAGAGFALRL
ncbi:alpha/beta-hydrolase [Exidia glandulosa HHB12029]|uniref:Alpha/beta-hydrolase n=1 Tax=Exidia glandulosa HHB12029 TaxID=1314781 RepID=A0A165P336_EXIGL|nr:alpha/beta-hydrolase [Exidia glandulosa HHB12029]